jgi:Amt family ammonium transporter
VHGVGGTWGAIATGLWASAAVNPAAFKAGGGGAVSEGLLISGHWGLLGYQALAVLTTYVLAAVGCLVCLGITSAVTGGLRVNEDDEFSGLDLSQHSENAYLFATGGYGGSSSAFGARPVEHRAAAHARAAD